jgi:hypothetical protein
MGVHMHMQTHVGPSINVLLPSWVRATNTNAVEDVNGYYVVIARWSEVDNHRGVDLRAAAAVLPTR